jgi:hypothetical protein
LSRRALLASLGAGAIALSPFVPLLNAGGTEAAMPKRLVLFFTPHGTIWDAWRPTGGGTNFTLGPILAPLARHQQKITVFDGIQIVGNGDFAGHTPASVHLWTGSYLSAAANGSYGWNTGPSIDQVIANQVGGLTAYPSLQLGDSSGGTYPGSRIIYADVAKPLDPMQDPAAAFKQLFTPKSGQAVSERLASLGVINAELSSLRPQIATADRFKVDAHLDALSAIQKRLQLTAQACQGPSPAPGTDNSIPTVITEQMDILAAALACDLTRIASLQLTFADNDGNVYTWLGITDNGHHPLSHQPDSDNNAKAELTKIYTWYADRFSYLLDKLDAIPEGSGTLLDNTLVVWGTELGTGNTHSGSPTPFVVAGGGGLGVTGGRYVKYANMVNHQRLLVSIANAMGLTQMTKFGNLDTGSGPLPNFLA